MALGDEFMHQRVAARPLGESAGGLHVVRVRLWLRLALRVRLCLARLGLDPTQPAAMAGNTALHRLAQVLPQVEPVGDLHRLWRPTTGALGVGAGAVPQITSTPGCARSQSANGCASRPASSSAGLLVSQSTSTVP